MTERVLVEVVDQVAEVVLNRANRKNAIDFEMFEAIHEAAETLAADSAVRAVVLRGAGGCFCAGIDVGMFTAADVDLGKEIETPRTPSPANVFQRAGYAWRELEVPVICAIDGVAFGGGLQIALGADVRFAARDARFSIMESEWGLIPDMAITTTLRGIATPDRVKELAWTARIVNAGEAAEIGLVTAVVDDPHTAARELARDCAGRSPEAMRGIKRLVNEAWRLSDADSLRLEARIQRRIIGSSNQLEAVAARLENRKPVFPD